MTSAQLQALLTKLLALPAETEWVEFKEAKRGYDFRELGKYVSALANEANLKDQRCGWVLTSLLMFELPDEIVQLAEGHRITAFFKLGETTDPEDKRRPIYLWTTSTGPPDQFQFDAFRVFAWNAARARYESTHRERNLRGYHPVLIDGGKIRLVYGARPDGPVERHSFELRGRKLHLLKREPWQPPDQNPVFAAPLPDEPDTTSTAAGTWQRVSAWVRSLRK